MDGKDVVKKGVCWMNWWEGNVSSTKIGTQRFICVGLEVTLPSTRKLGMKRQRKTPVVRVTVEWNQEFGDEVELPNSTLGCYNPFQIVSESDTTGEDNVPNSDTSGEQ